MEERDDRRAAGRKESAGTMGGCRHRDLSGVDHVYFLRLFVNSERLKAIV